MSKYRIVSARPKNANGHLNSQFKMYMMDEKIGSWTLNGWKSIADVNNLLQDGHEVLTGKVTNGKMSSGAAVELELRIAKNDTKYKINDMPED